MSEEYFYKLLNEIESLTYKDEMFGGWGFGFGGSARAR
jgi:hypothetical protein